MLYGAEASVEMAGVMAAFRDQVWSRLKAGTNGTQGKDESHRANLRCGSGLGVVGVGDFACGGEWVFL